MQINGRSTNLDQNGEYAPVWHQKCDRLENQMSSNHPCLQLNQAHKSKRRLSEESMTTSKCRKVRV